MFAYSISCGKWTGWGQKSDDSSIIQKSSSNWIFLFSGFAANWVASIFRNFLQLQKSGFISSFKSGVIAKSQIAKPIFLVQEKSLVSWNNVKPQNIYRMLWSGLLLHNIASYVTKLWYTLYLKNELSLIVVLCTRF